MSLYGRYHATNGARVDCPACGDEGCEVEDGKVKRCIDCGVTSFSPDETIAILAAANDAHANWDGPEVFA